MSERGPDRGTESFYKIDRVAAEYEAAIGACPEGIDLCRVERFGKQRLIRGCPRLWRRAQREIERVWRNRGIGLRASVRGEAGPGIGGGITHDAGAHRVQFDIALTSKEICLRFYQTGPEPTLPQRAGAMIGPVDVLNVALPKPLHQRGEIRLGGRCHQ